MHETYTKPIQKKKTDDFCYRKVGSASVGEQKRKMYELTKYQKIFCILEAHVEKEKNILKIEMSIQNKGVEKGLRNNLSHVYLHIFYMLSKIGECQSRQRRVHCTEIC